MTTEFEKRRTAALNQVKKWHAGQNRSNGRVPVWHHLDRVSRLLQIILEETQEGSEDERETISLSGLGHDAIEDTSVTTAELERYFGSRGLELINGMTNRLGDAHPAEYVDQVSHAEEAVRLIKFADLYDNCTSVTYDFATLGMQWTEGFFLPIVSPMITAVMPTTFEIYKETSTRLKSLVAVSYAQLNDEIKRFKDHL